MKKIISMILFTLGLSLAASALLAQSCQSSDSNSKSEKISSETSAMTLAYERTLPDKVNPNPSCNPKECDPDDCPPICLLLCVYNLKHQGISADCREGRQTYAFDYGGFEFTDKKLFSGSDTNTK